MIRITRISGIIRIIRITWVIMIIRILKSTGILRITGITRIARTIRITRIIVIDRITGITGITRRQRQCPYGPPREEAILQISGAGHWFLEGWIGDDAVDFLVDSGSAVTALSCRFYQTLLKAGAPVGVLRPMDRRLRGANGSPITISGCASCMVSFLGLRTEFPVLVCDLSTDAIIGTDTLGSILPHILRNPFYRVLYCNVIPFHTSGGKRHSRWCR